MALWEKQSTPAQARAVDVDQGLRSYMLKVYNYMASATLLTGIIAYFAGNSTAFLQLMFAVNGQGQVTGISPLGWLITLAPIGLVIFMSVRLQSMSSSTLQLIFWAYSALIALSLAPMFLLYTQESIARVFFITAGTFGLLSIYGYSTKRDLTSWGSFLTVGVLAVFFTSLANAFIFKSEGVYNAISYIGVLLALGLTAYDTQKVKETYYYYAHGSAEALQKATIMGALKLYFDFIYLFVHLMRIMGNRR